MSRRTIPQKTDPEPYIRNNQNVRLTRPHWVNGRSFDAGTVLSLPELCARNLVQNHAAKLVPDETDPNVPPSTDDN
jgi:hypothetical protein